ncbi:MAG: hypothetical protein F2667_08935 [Actinobacteria bacterium]|uniref:Unannotated protein n=1 Tax=freshwater metagenome TaxID=449393 RepID=A0A6J6QWW1_9ZZZZ|nr:hypothetical protein [Actinomycetota bacterium]
MTVPHLVSLVVLAAEEEHHVDPAISYGIGGLALGILLFLLFALIGFGNGREHS